CGISRGISLNPVGLPMCSFKLQFELTTKPRRARSGSWWLRRLARAQSLHKKLGQDAQATFGLRAPLRALRGFVVNCFVFQPVASLALRSPPGAPARVGNPWASLSRTSAAL